MILDSLHKAINKSNIDQLSVNQGSLEIWTTSNINVAVVGRLPNQIHLSLSVALDLIFHFILCYLIEEVFQCKLLLNHH